MHLFLSIGLNACLSVRVFVRLIVGLSVHQLRFCTGTCIDGYMRVCKTCTKPISIDWASMQVGANGPTPPKGSFCHNRIEWGGGLAVSRSYLSCSEGLKAEIPTLSHSKIVSSHWVNTRRAVVLCIQTIAASGHSSAPT